MFPAQGSLLLHTRLLLRFGGPHGVPTPFPGPVSRSLFKQQVLRDWSDFHLDNFGNWAKNLSNSNSFGLNWAKNLSNSNSFGLNWAKNFRNKQQSWFKTRPKNSEIATVFGLNWAQNRRNSNSFSLNWANSFRNSNNFGSKLLNFAKKIRNIAKVFGFNLGQKFLK